MKSLLSLDLSTNCTGWSLFNVEDGSLIDYGIVKGKSFKDSSSQRALLRKLEYMASSVLNLITNYKPTYIVIEEIAGSKNRISQKTLDMVHGILWKTIEPFLDLVSYYDVSGPDGWRYHLGLKLTEQDKILNRENKKTNKTLHPGATKLPIVTQKDTACRYVNKTYRLTLDVQERSSDADMADSIAMGSAWLKFRKPVSI